MDATLDHDAAVFFVANVTGADTDQVRDLFDRLDPVGTIDYAVDVLDRQDDDYDFAYLSGDVRVRSPDHAPGTSSTLDPDLAARMAAAIKHFNVTLDEYLYHCDRRPTWFGCVSSISDHAGTDVTLVGSSDHTFTVESVDPLPDDTLDNFELHRVDDIPENEIEMHV